MLQLMEQNVLLYAMAAVSVLGVASQVILCIVYERLIRDMQKPAYAKGKYMKHLKQKYNMYRRTQTGSESIRIFIQKSMMEYKFLGMNLHTWSRMGKAAFFLCAAMGAAGWYLSGVMQMAEEIQQNYLWASVAAGLLIAGGYGALDNGYRRSYLEMGLRSLFTNESTRYVQQVDLSDVRPAQESPFAQHEKELPGPKKRSKVVETKAQRDKRELKANLAKIKEGMEETAAADVGAKKEKNMEILRQMDSSEQERVIREVLQEFL